MSTDYDMQRARQRDEAADEIERCRVRWHEARSARDAAIRELDVVYRTLAVAEAEYRASVARYDALK